MADESATPAIDLADNVLQKAADGSLQTINGLAAFPSVLQNDAGDVKSLDGTVFTALSDARINAQGAGYIRYESGLQLCWGRNSLTSDITFAEKGLYRSSTVSSALTITFPVAFIAAPAVTCNHVSVGSGQRGIWATQEGVLADRFNVVLLCIQSQASRAYDINWMATGLWK